MAVSEVDIWNLALEGMGHVPVAHPNERSPEASYCRRFYPQARDKMLEDFDWEFARVVEDLTKLGDEELCDSWYFAYQHPADCLRVRRIINPFAPPMTSGSITPTYPQYPYPPANDPLSRYAYGGGASADDNVHFEVMLTRSRTGKKIMCNLDEAKARYTVPVTDVSQFSPTFIEALSESLKSYLIMVISKDKDRMQMSRQAAVVAADIAKRATLQEFAPRPTPTPRRVAVR